MASRDAAEIEASRVALEIAVGEGGVLDAVCVISQFAAMTRIVDASGHTSTAISSGGRAVRTLSRIRQSIPFF